MEQQKKVIVNFGKFDDIELPPVIYKYRTWSSEFHKRFLTKREVFMASPKTFEDELDCHNPTRFDLLTKKQIYDYFIWSSKNDHPNFTRQQHREFARYWSKVSAVNSTQIVKNFMDESIEEYYKHEGILSLTEDWDNNDMWNKYADNGKGICIGYNTKIMFNYLGGGGPVEYVDELPIILPEPFMDFAEALRNRVYCKLKKWEFEKEYRTKKFFFNPPTEVDRQIKLPPEAFNRIILGNNISDEDKSEISYIVINNIGNIEIVQRKDVKKWM